MRNKSRGAEKIAAARLASNGQRAIVKKLSSALERYEQPGQQKN
jgi:hypothetical protein